MRKQKGYRAFNGRSPLQLLELLGPDGPSVSQSINQSLLHSLPAIRNAAETLKTLQQIRVKSDDVCASLTSKESTILKQDRFELSRNEVFKGLYN